MAPKQLPIRLPDDVRRRLEAEARRLDLSLNAVIVFLLDRYLPPQEGLPAVNLAPEPPPAGDALDFD